MLYRTTSQIIGARMTGKLSQLMYRFHLIHPELKTYFVLSTEPLIIYLGNVMRHLFEIAELFKNRRVYFIKNFYHTFEADARIPELIEQYQQFRTYYPQHKIYFMCATGKEQKLFAQNGLEPCYFINKNAFVDERQYNIIPEAEKKFDAIYNAQLSTYKRHQLASQVRNLSLIVYRHPYIGRTPENDEYIKMVRRELSSATWFNDIDQRIPPSQVPTYLNRARVGLCLSAEEGPMAASMEYMLCGLPVVSTRSLGGRDVFFNPEYSIIVNDHKKEIADAVLEILDRNLSPEYVRNCVLKKVEVHRKRFIDLVDEIYKDNGLEKCFAEEFNRLFVNKLRTSAPFPGALITHANKGMPIETCRYLARNMVT